MAWYAPAVVLASAALLLVVSALYGFAVTINKAGIANPLILLAFVFGVGFVGVWTTRIGKIRSAGLGSVCAVVLLVACLAGSLVGLGAAPGFSSGFAAWKERWTAGVSLLPNKWLLHGAWGWAAAVGEALILCVVCFSVTLLEAARPFCENCTSWARKSRWQVTFDAPPELMLNEVKNSKTVRSVVRIVPGGGKGKLACKVGACDCGCTATLELKHKFKNSTDGPETSEAIVEDLSLTPASVNQVFAWGERVDPKVAGRRPTLQLQSKPNEPLGVVPKPSTSEWKTMSQQHWGGFSLGIIDECDNEYTRVVRHRIRAGDLHIIDEAMRSQRSADDLACVAFACGNWMARDSPLRQQAEDHAQTAPLLLARGIERILEAWSVRGGGFNASKVGKVIELTTEADALLQQAAALAPKDPTAWAWRMQALKTLAVPGLSSFTPLFEEVLARAPQHRMAHVIMLEAHMPKWYGTKESMLAFARERAACAPSGSPVGVLLPMAHLEASRDARRNGIKNYFQDPAIAQELRAANEKVFRPGSFKPSMDTPYVRSAFAVAMFAAGDKEAAAEHLRFVDVGSGAFFDQGIFFWSTETLKSMKRACGLK